MFVFGLLFCHSKANNWGIGNILLLGALEYAPKMTFSELLHYWQISSSDICHLEILKGSN